MPEPARRFTATPYDQFEDADQVFDWGGDDLFTRMPRPRAVDDAPAPRFTRAPANDAPGVNAGAPHALVLLGPPRERRGAAAVDRRGGRGDRRRESQPAEHRSVQTAEQLGLSAVAPAGGPAYRRATAAAISTPAGATAHRPDEKGAAPREPAYGTNEPGAKVADSGYRWDETGALIVPRSPGRRTSVVTGDPGGVPRPLPIVRAERAERRRAPRTPVEWIGSRPERIVGWAFALGLLLILIAISTADAATV